jgi:peptidyl-tRNA hydrolase, PTH1 family
MRAGQSLATSATRKSGIEIASPESQDDLMKLVVGLGNPGRKYAGTRHNVGFEVLAELASRCGAASPQLKFEAELLDVQLAGARVLLAAPQTYMNLSGRAVRQIVMFFKLPLDEVLIICDDLNLPCGKLRLRRSGSAGGQKGLQNIIDQVGSQEIARLRIGIDRPANDRIDPVDYVLSRFFNEQRKIIDAAIPAAADAVELWVAQGIDAAMNRINPQQT